LNNDSEICKSEGYKLLELSGLHKGTYLKWLYVSGLLKRTYISILVHL